MRFDVRLPATLKHAFDLHPGVVTWYDTESEQVGVQARINAVVGEDVEVRLELKGAGRLAYFEVAVVRVGERNRVGVGEFDFRVTRIAADDRAALESWVANAAAGRGQSAQIQPQPPVAVVRASNPARTVVDLNPAPEVPLPASRAASPAVSGQPAPGPDRIVHSDWDSGMVSVRWTSAGAFCAEWDRFLQFAGLLIPLDGDAPPFGTTCDISLFLVDDTVLTIPASVVGRTGGQLALQLTFTKAERERLMAVSSQSRRVPFQARGAR